MPGLSWRPESLAQVTCPKFFFFFFCGSLCEKIGQVENIRIKLRDRKSKGGGESAVE